MSHSQSQDGKFELIRTLSKDFTDIYDVWTMKVYICTAKFNSSCIVPKAKEKHTSKHSQGQFWM